MVVSCWLVMKLRRREFLSSVPVALAVAAGGARRAEAQDRDFLRALDETQRHRPGTLGTRARIAPETEPGTPLNIRGQVVDANGRPVQGAIVFAYQTDRGGLYDEPARGAHSWRLRGWARTDAEGRYEFATIRPGSYPGRRVPAHVHFNIYVGDVRYGAGELRFDDDPLVENSIEYVNERRAAWCAFNSHRLPAFPLSRLRQLVFEFLDSLLEGCVVVGTGQRGAR